MSSSEPNELELRIAQLEQRVAELESRASSPAPAAERGAEPPTRRADAAPGLAPPAGATPHGASTAPAPTRASARPDAWFETGEGWLGRAGVGLLAIGFIFLFRYAVDRG